MAGVGEAKQTRTPGATLPGTLLFLSLVVYVMVGWKWLAAWAPLASRAPAQLWFLH